MLLQLSHFFLPFIPFRPVHPPSTSIPPLQFMPIGHTYKFFGFSISYTIPNLPLSILYLPFMLPIPCTFSPILPLITLHVISTSVILFLFQLFAQFVLFLFFLGLVADSCEFVVILLFLFLIIFFFQINLFNISYNKGLVMMNSFNLTLSGKHFICPSILHDSFAGQSHLGCRSLPFMTFFKNYFIVV